MTVCRLVAAAGVLTLAATIPAHALSTDQYLALRRKCGWDPRLTLSVAQSDPSAYAGRPIELRGLVSGTVVKEGATGFLLTVDGGRSLLLTAPAADVRMVSGVNHQALRVLGRVAGTSASGNVVGVDVLALASDSEVTARESEAAARMAASRPAPAQPGPASGVFSEREHRAPPTSRNGYWARQMSGAASGLPELARRYLSPEAQAVYPYYSAFIGRHNKRLTTDELEQITVSILYFSQKHRVDPRLVVAMIIAESDFNPRSTSSKGAMGLGQIMPDEARDHGLANPYDPIQNVRTSVNLLKMKLNLFWEPGSRDGYPTVTQVVKALAAYNAGAGAVKRYGGVPPYRETQGYVRKILRIYGQLCGA